jgi:hypothetical protein
MAAFAATLVSLFGTASPSSAAVPRTFYGVVPETTLTDGDYAGMAADRVGGLRFQMFWPQIEPLEPVLGIHAYEWSATDAIVKGAVENGIQPLPVVFGTPSYLSDCAGGGRRCQVKIPVKTAPQRAAWTQFVREAVERYGPEPAMTSPKLVKNFWFLNPTLPYEPIRTWQIWNEQNNLNVRAAVKGYMRLLKLTRGAMSVDDPGAKLMLGGMFGTPSDSTARTDTSWGFLSGLYKAGAKPFFDSVALHPYSPNLKGISYQIKRIRKVMDANGDRSAKIYVTELGWGSGGDTGAHELVKTPTQQKRLLAKSFSMLRDHRGGWGIGGLYWFSWEDPPPGTGLCGFCYSSGLYHHDGVAKPALDAYRGFTAATKRR